MSQENVENHQRGVDAFNRRDLDAFLAIADTEVEFRSRLLAVEGGSYHGHEGARLWWESLLAAFPDFQIEAVAVRGAGDYTIANIHNRGHGGEAMRRLMKSFGKSPGGVTASLSLGRCTGVRPKPSKPPGCRSSRPVTRTYLLSQPVERPMGAAVSFNQ